MKTSISHINEYPAKRVISGLGAAKRRSGVGLRDTLNLEDQGVQCCNRLGCSIRYSSMRSSAGALNKTKCSKPSTSSTSGKKKIGSTKPHSQATELRKPRNGSQNQSSSKGPVSTEASSVQIDMEVTDSIPSTEQIQTSFSGEAKDAESGILKGFSIGISEELERHSLISNSETKTRIHRQCRRSNQDSSLGSSFKSAAPKNVSQPSNSAKSASPVQGANGSRYGLRNFGCKPTANIFPLGSSSHMTLARRPDLVAKSSNGESSSARRKIMKGSSSRAPSISQSSPSRPVLSLSERSPSQQVSRRTIYEPSCRDGAASIRAKRSVNSKNNAQANEHGTIPRLRRTELLIRGPIPRSSLQQSQAELFADRDNSYDQPSCSNENICNQVIAPTENGSTHPLRSPSFDHNGFQSLNIDGIAEVLLALDRIEQDEELTNEQLWILEAHLFVGGLSLHDQHRDMRLDIDNMSYEELLALEERMGSVSTALTEEALSNCLKRSYYKTVSPEKGSKSYEDDDLKCSICQEEYTEGDEVGKLGCNHLYHVVCIHQWLRQKNWCPICKASAAPS